MLGLSVIDISEGKGDLMLTALDSLSADQTSVPSTAKDLIFDFG